MLSFFPRGVLDEILNLIESVSEDFLSYSYTPKMSNGLVQYIRVEESTSLHWVTVIQNTFTLIVYKSEHLKF